MKICIKHGLGKICFTVPTFPPLVPIPNPIPHPDPGPWITATDIDSRTATALQAIATMASVTHLLPQTSIPAMQRSLEASANSVTAHLSDVQLTMPWAEVAPVAH